MIELKSISKQYKVAVKEKGLKGYTKMTKEELMEELKKI